ncbi:hypothetical protein MR657_07470 [bacterium]|nr:hypothetical protein [bacterium]
MKKEILEVRLKGNCADTRDGVLRLGGAQSYGIYRLHITADEAWQGLAIAATFDCGGSPVTVVPAEDGLLDVPAEATASANTSCHPGSITFWGSNSNGDVRRVSARLLYRVYPTGSITGGNAIPPTPEVAEQLLARLDGKLDTPANTGAAGQVPVLQPDGSTLWGSVAGGTGTGGAVGADGGYYAPSVTQPDANIMRVSFTQSKADMPDVPSKDITLPAGPAGLTPYIGDNGNWYLGNTDTGIKAAGSDGTTPTIGANGNWWIGGKDTGMAAAGQAATIEIVGTETLPADQPAAVVETEDSTAQARKYTVKVPQGNTGATPDIKIGTVETLPAGSAATASMTGTPKNPLLNLGIPSGGGASVDYITIPASAEVGQTIVVKAVDENGKPTEWEAVDLPSGGGQEIDKIAIKITETVHSISLLDDITLYNRIRANIKVVGDSANAAAGVLGAITPSGVLVNYILNATKTATGYLFFDLRLSEQGAESDVTQNFSNFAYNAAALSHTYGMNRTRWTGALSLVPKATDWNFGAGTEIYLEAYRA